MTDVRQSIVNWAKWGVDNRINFTYTEDSTRMEGIGHPGVPCHADCSAFVTLCYNWAGAPDPNAQGYDGQGYTGTLLAHGTEIPLEQVIPGDVIVYGPDTGWHTALIVESGPDPLTVSHGEQGDPNYCRVSWDGRLPQRYLRFDTTLIGTNSDPNPTPQPQPEPTPKTPGDEEMAIAKINANNMDHVFYVDNNGNFGHNFKPAGGQWGRDAANITGLLPNATPTAEVADNTIHVYVRGNGNKVRHYSQKFGKTDWTEEKLP